MVLAQDWLNSNKQALYLYVSWSQYFVTGAYSGVMLSSLEGDFNDGFVLGLRYQPKDLRQVVARPPRTCVDH